MRKKTFQALREGAKVGPYDEMPMLPDASRSKWTRNSRLHGRVALSVVEDPSIFRFPLHLRMAQLLVPPFNEEHLRETLVRLAQHLANHPANTGTLGKAYAFVASKGGVGASTIAANAARAFA